MYEEGQNGDGHTPLKPELSEYGEPFRTDFDPFEGAVLHEVHPLLSKFRKVNNNGKVTGVDFDMGVEVKLANGAIVNVPSERAHEMGFTFDQPTEHSPNTYINRHITQVVHGN